MKRAARSRSLAAFGLLLLLLLAAACGSSQYATQSPSEMLGAPGQWTGVLKALAGPSVAEISQYLVIAMGDDADVSKAFLQVGTEIGADRVLLSVSNDPGYVTDGSFPNLAAVFGTRWNTGTNPDSLNSAAPIFQGVDWSGEVALTSDNGTQDVSNSLVFADTGIQRVAAPRYRISRIHFTSMSVRRPRPAHRWPSAPG